METRLNPLLDLYFWNFETANNNYGCDRDEISLSHTHSVRSHTRTFCSVRQRLIGMLISVIFLSVLCAAYFIRTHAISFVRLDCVHLCVDRNRLLLIALCAMCRWNDLSASVFEYFKLQNILRVAHSLSLSVPLDLTLTHFDSRGFSG